MNYGIMEALNQLTRERRVDKQLLFETLEIGLTTAIKKKYGNNAVVDVEIDEEKGTLHPYLVKTVVENEDEIEDPVCQITMEEAHEDDPNLEVGDEVRELLPFSDFGRNAIALAKQVLVQRVREVERGKVFDEFKGRVGEIITGTVQQQDRTGVLVSLGKAEAFLPRKESIRRERWHQGLPIKAFVVEVLDVTKGPQIILSRTHPGLIEKLFETEVPEIYDGIVEIRSVARDAGGRSKIAVYSKDERVDAVGACVGMKGSRVQAVVKELAGERVDIVPWSDDPQQFVTKALSPARVQSIRVKRDAQDMTVVVDDDQLSLAIGREGQNVRLAVRLTGWKIDLVSSTEMAQRERLDKELRIALDEVEGLEAEEVALLEGAGLHTLKELKEADVNDLLAISGMDAERVERVQAVASERAAQVEAEFVDALKAEQHLFDEEMFDRVPEEETEGEASTLTFKEEEEVEAEAAPGSEEETSLADAAPEGDETEPMATLEDSSAQDAAQADAAEEAAASLAPEPDGGVEAELEPVAAADAGDDTENATHPNLGSSADAESAEEPGPKPGP
ncbi:MAG: transcription termination/antitermination protein NusA [Candidatus Latescibacterota bacterium]|nr:MAG: transcription termination/antitermination protein NusA [Candidatus Latescibacterota bacterium]